MGQELAKHKDNESACQFYLDSFVNYHSPTKKQAHSKNYYTYFQHPVAIPLMNPESHPESYLKTIPGI